MGIKLKKCSVISIVVLCFLLGSIVTAQAQELSRKITGVVTDEQHEPLMGVTVSIVGSTVGVTTDMDGHYILSVPQGKSSISFSYVGYGSKKLLLPEGNALNVQLFPSQQTLNDVVVIGYGTQKKGDLTGSVSNVNTKDFNTGLISSPEQLINGKVSGVQIMSNSGSPTAGSTIRVRGGASLNASNDPLIVLDGVPLESGGISGNSGNFLSLINPSDIESITILKDASSTAIYGSRASNGVIIITTKKGAQNKMKISFSTTNSAQVRTKLPDMLSRDEFVNVINSEGTDAQKALLGSGNTNWSNQVYKTAFGTDNNVSISGKLLDNMPARVSLGAYDQDGLVRTDNATRYTGNLSLSPSFLKNDLKFNINLKGSYNKNQFANSNAIWAAATYNPTLPVYSGNDDWGGYTEAIDNTNNPVNGAVRNPLGLLKQYKSTSDVKRIIGNVDMDYKVYFLPDLHFHAIVGYDYAEGKGHIYVPSTATQYYTTGGRDYEYGPQKKSNKLLTTYFNYTKYLGSLKSNIDATVGYDYQFWKSTTPKYDELNASGVTESTTAATDERHALISYYGRLNYTFDSRYMLTATMRYDGTSRFSKNNRWGAFPSVAFAWRVNDESWMKWAKALSNLKLRASYGITGQQDGIGNYNYIPVYTISQSGAEYQFGNNYFMTYRPSAYVSNLKWETTSAYNFGLDFGFLKDRISGSVDYYTRKTKDLLATVNTPAGTNFNKTVLTNVGNVNSHGIEASLNLVPIDNRDFTWNVSMNATWQKMKVTNLSLTHSSATTNLAVGPTIDSYSFQVLSEGYSPYMFYVYHQLYNTDGKPIEGAYADLNNDGSINSSDLYRDHSPAPDYILGFSTSFRYKKLTVSTSLRANIGNYAYNGTAMDTGAWSTVSYNSYQLNNLNHSYLKTGFNSRQYLSDYYVENASFLKMDNLSLNYNFGKINRLVSANVGVMMQNVFTWTKYTGVDPEVPNGMDSSFYPRPRIYSLSIGLEF